MDDYNENDALWETLGRARPAKASPYFVRRVLREVRNERQAPARWQMLLRWLIPVGAAAAIAVTFASWQIHHQRDVSDFNACFDSAADLESLVAFDNSSDWVDVN